MHLFSSVLLQTLSGLNLNTFTSSSIYHLRYKFSQPFEPPVEACTSFYLGILAQKATRLGRFLDPRWYMPLFGPLLLTDNHPLAPLPLTHYHLAMCIAAWSESPSEASTSMLSRGVDIVTFEILPGRPNK